MSIKDYPTAELLAEIAARVRTDSPLCDPQELRDMLIKSESECSELRAQVERLTRELSTERDTSNQRLTEIYDRARKAEKELDALQARVTEWEMECGFLRNEARMGREHFEKAQACVERLTRELSTERDTSNQRLTEIYDRARKAEKERDALQARIDAGVRVYRTSNEEWMERKYAGSGASGLLIDIEYMHPDDDRNGEADRNAYRTTDLDAALTLDIEAVERKKRADGSTTPRTGERRKEQAQPITCHHCGLVYERGEEKIHNKDTRDPSGANERRKA